MFQNYLKVALRNIRKQKFYAALNILGLALGLTASLLIGLYINDELSFDKFHEDYENIYLTGLHLNIGGQEFKTTGSCPPLASTMLQDIPGIQDVTRVNPWPLKNLVVKYKDRAFTEQNAVLVDPNFFNFFSFKLLEGNTEAVLTKPFSVVLTRSAASKLFGAEIALGKIITVGEANEAFEVTGIAEPAPSNSHIQYDMLLSSESDAMMKSGGWGDLNGIYTYYKKTSNTPLEFIEERLKGIALEHAGPEIEEGFGVSFAEFEANGGIYAFFSYSLASSHLYHTEIQDRPKSSSDIKYVSILSIVGLIILLIASINFMNLSTARSANRIKEVGLRKTFGSIRSKLIVQFLTESFVYLSIAMAIAMAAAYIFLPFFSSLSEKELSLKSLLSSAMLVPILVIYLIVGFLSASYPSFYITSFKVTDVLKGKIGMGTNGNRIRSSLVVTQLAISIALIICTIVIYSQLKYMHSKNIGLDKQNVLVLKNTSRLSVNKDAFIQALSVQTGIEEASYLDIVFPELGYIGAFRPVGANKDFLLGEYYADYYHKNVLKLEMLEGRYFSKEFASDSLACVINEAAMRELDWISPLGEKLFSHDRSQNLHVIGVVKDFNIESFKVKVKPLVIQFTKTASNMLIRYNPDSFAGASALVTSINTIWNKHTDNEPFEYAFLDQSFDNLFSEERRSAQLLTIMSFIAIFVSCLGLLGLAAFTAEQRTREIGIRKVLGASVAAINTMLSKQFMLLVLISFVIASSIGWYGMSEWLSTYAYRIELEPVVFLVTGTAAAVIAWLTVSYHFIKAARSNPVDSLRYD